MKGLLRVEIILKVKLLHYETGSIFISIAGVMRRLSKAHMYFFSMRHLFLSSPMISLTSLHVIKFQKQTAHLTQSYFILE